MTCNHALTAYRWNAFKSALAEAHAIDGLEFEALDFTSVEASFFTELALVTSLRCMKFIDCVPVPHHFTDAVLRYYVAQITRELNVKRSFRSLRAFEVIIEGTLHFCSSRPGTKGLLTIDGLVVSDKFLRNFCEVG